MPDLVLHHNGMSSCSQKVRLALAEKGLSFTSREVNLVAGEQRAQVDAFRVVVQLLPVHRDPGRAREGAGQAVLVEQVGRVVGHAGVDRVQAARDALASRLGGGSARLHP